MNQREKGLLSDLQEFVQEYWKDFMYFMSMEAEKPTKEEVEALFEKLKKTK